MAVEVTIPGPLLQYTKNQKEVQLTADSVLEAVKELDKKFPGLKDRIFDEQEKIREYVNIFVNSEEIRQLQREQTRLKDGDKVMILPSIAGGNHGF